MDGDSSTTDASQLGITGEYMAGSHFVLQTQDGKCRQTSYKIIQMLYLVFIYILYNLLIFK